MVFLIGLFQTWWYWLFLHLNQQTMYLVTVYHHNAVTIHPVKIDSFLKYQYIHHDWLVFNANFSCITAVFNIYILTLIKQSFQGGWYVLQTKLSGGVICSPNKAFREGGGGIMFHKQSFQGGGGDMFPKQSFQGGWYVPQTKLSRGWYVPFVMKNGDWWFVHTRFQKRNLCAQYALFL